MAELRVLNPSVCGRFITVGERDVTFDDEGVSEPLTQEEYTLLLSIPPFQCLEAWRREFGLAPEVVPELRSGAVLPASLTAGPPPPEELETLLSGEGTEEGPCPRTFFMQFLKLGETQKAQELFAGSFELLVETWSYQSAPVRAAIVTDGPLPLEQLTTLLNVEVGGKNAKSVVAAIESERDRLFAAQSSPRQINAALVKASAPPAVPEE